MKKPKYIFVDPSKSMAENIERSIKLEEWLKRELEKEKEE